MLLQELLVPSTILANEVCHPAKAVSSFRDDGPKLMVPQYPGISPSLDACPDIDTPYDALF